MGIGYAILVGALRITPEFAFSFGSMEAERSEAEDQEFWYFAPLLSLSGAF